MLRALAAVSAAVLLTAAPADAVDPPPAPPSWVEVDWGCDLVSFSPGSSSTWTVVAAPHASAYSPTPERNPVSWEHARCLVRVNGSTVHTLPLTPVGPVAAASPTTFQLTLGEWDFVETCFDFAVVDALGARTAYTDCPNLSYQIPWWMTYGVDVLDWAVSSTDPVLCADGDVYVLGELVWDCPPFGGR